MAVALAAMAAAGVSAQTQPQIRITPENARLSAYLHELANPGALAGVAGGAMLERLRHEDRTNLTTDLASGTTQRVVGVSVRHGLAAAMHVSTKYQYHLCGCRGFGPRVAHALVETFTDRRDDGGRSVAAPRIAASYAESFTGLAWKHDRSVGRLLSGTTLSFGGQALFNLGRELTRIQVHIHPRNGSGELRDGTTTDRPTPVPVAGSM